MNVVDNQESIFICGGFTCVRCLVNPALAVYEQARLERLPDEAVDYFDLLGFQLDVVAAEEVSERVEHLCVCEALHGHQQNDRPVRRHRGHPLNTDASPSTLGEGEEALVGFFRLVSTQPALGYEGLGVRTPDTFVHVDAVGTGADDRLGKCQFLFGR